MFSLAIFGLLIAILVSDAFLKPGWQKYLTTLVSMILGLLVSFGYYEPLAAYIKFLPSYAYVISFVLLLGFSTAILRLLSMQLTKKLVKIPDAINRLISMICAASVAYILTGVIIIAMLISPISIKYVYQRFPDDEILTAGNIDDMKKSSTLGFENSLLSLITHVSGGSLSSQNAFGLVHADFANQHALNKLNKDTVDMIAGKNAISFNKDLAKTLKLAPANLKDEKQEAVKPASDSKLYIVTAYFNGSKIKDGGVCNDKTGFDFSTSQLRLICTENESARVGLDVYPIGYIDPIQKTLIRKTLNDISSYKKADFTRDGKYLEMNLVFELPANAKPVAIGYRQNFIAALPQESKRQTQENQKTTNNSEE